MRASVVARPGGVCGFGPFGVDPSRRVLWREEGAARTPIALSGRSFDLLLCLMGGGGAVISKATLMEAVWPNTLVEENNLHQAISALRRALGERPGENRFVVTVQGVGFGFAAAIRHDAALPAGPGDAAPIVLGVLPFLDLAAGGGGAPHLADGLTEDLIVSLGQLGAPALCVVGRTTMMTFRGSGATLLAIGQSLGAAYLVEGTLRDEAGRLRVTATLVRVHDQVQVWADSYERMPHSILTLQRDLSLAIAEAIHLRLSPARVADIGRRQTADPAAYDLYLRGRVFWNQMTPATTRRAIEFYRLAAAASPDYALAWSGIADAFTGGPVTGDMDPAVAAREAAAALARAEAANPRLAETLASRGFYEMWLGWNWPRALAALTTATVQDPSYAFAWRLRGIVLMHMSRTGEAATSLEQACMLDPLDVMHRSLAAQVAYAARDPVAAAKHADRALALSGEFWIAHFQAAQAALGGGELDTALAHVQSALAISRNSKSIGLRGYLLARLGRTEAARGVLDELAHPAPGQFRSHYAAATVHLGLGHDAAAFGALEQALSQRDVNLAFITFDPKWDPLRRDRRFEELLASCRFHGGD